MTRGVFVHMAKRGVNRKTPEQTSKKPCGMDKPSTPSPGDDLELGLASQLLSESGHSEVLTLVAILWRLMMTLVVSMRLAMRNGNFLGSIFGRTDSSRIFCLRGFCHRILDFFSFSWAKAPRKILQENPLENSSQIHTTKVSDTLNLTRGRTKIFRDCPSTVSCTVPSCENFSERN